jgi:hypothetical protein
MCGLLHTSLEIEACIFWTNQARSLITDQRCILVTKMVTNPSPLKWQSRSNSASSLCGGRRSVLVLYFSHILGPNIP